MKARRLDPKRRAIAVDVLARVEGEGALRVVVDGDRVTGVELRIFEPPRFFEALLRGRGQHEAPDITARICGICPVAYQMSACRAVEAAHGVEPGPEIDALRRLLYCGEWIESHVLHITMLHAPDFLGYASAMDMAREHRGAVERGLRLKKAGNAIMRLLGGREIHPINVCVGGFYRAPARRELEALVPELEWAREAALETVRWVAGFEFPDHERDVELVALVHPDEYPMSRGRIGSSAGFSIAASEWSQTFQERQVPYSNALHSVRRGAGAYLTGPLARFGLNFERLAPVARRAALEVGLAPPCKNPFRSIVVRAVEVLHAFDEALRLIAEYRPPAAPAAPVPRRAGVGHGATEAPRGLLYHRYRVGDDGLIEEAEIVPPTSQNQLPIEEDLAALVAGSLDLDDAALTARCEQAIRNYDPCISCATHFLDLEIERR